MNTRAPSTGTALSAAAGDRMGTQLIRSRKTVTHANTHISTPAYPHVPTTVGHSVTRAIATESPTSASASAPGTGSTSDSTAMHITNWGTLVEEIGPLESEEFLKQYHQLHENIRHQITQKQHKQSLDKDTDLLACIQTNAFKDAKPWRTKRPLKRVTDKGEVIGPAAAADGERGQASVQLVTSTPKMMEMHEKVGNIGFRLKAMKSLIMQMEKKKGSNTPGAKEAKGATEANRGWG